jgi:CubicO group peptidase (beta-lactamase class C family)
VCCHGFSNNLRIIDPDLFHHFWADLISDLWLTEEVSLSSSTLTRVPLSANEFPRTFSVLQKGVADRVAPGFVAGFWSRKNPEIYRSAHFGVRRWLPSEQPLSEDTIFDLASVTKVFGTASMIADLVERGKLKWDTRVSDILKGYPFKEIRIRHLLSHTGGFIAWQPLWEMLNAKFSPKHISEISVENRQSAMREIVLAIAPEVPVETRALYSDISFLILGFVIEELTQLPLDRAITELLWRPMGIERAYYRHVTTKAAQPKDLNSGVAATEDSAWRGGILQGQVHDDNTWAMGGYAGHAGAFGDVRDVLYFAKRLFEGHFSLKIRDEMWTPVDWPQGCTRTLGWDTPSAENSLLGEKMSHRSVGHWGYTGTSLWIDPDREFAVALLSNRVHPTRENMLIKELRPKFHDALIEDLTQVGDFKQNL